YWKIRQRLLRVPGVVNVAIWGEHLDQLLVPVDPKRMRQRGVSLEQVMEATSKATDAGLLQFSTGHFIGTGGFIDTPNQRIGIQHVLPVVTPKQLAEIPIQKGRGGARIGDVANVREGSMPLIGDAVINGGPGLLLIVEKFPGANTLDVTRGVDAALDIMRPGLPGITMDSHIFRPATFIDMAIHNLAIALLIGCALVVLVLFSFLYEWRTALISLVAIPLSLVAAGLVLDLRGATINTMVLAGLVVAVGVVVDDAIIDIENILRRLRLQRKEGRDISTARIVLEASLEVRSAIFYATLINVLAVVPVFFMTSLSGSFFRPLAMSYALAVLVSMLVALTVTPALAFVLLRDHEGRRESPLVGWLQRGYNAALSRIVDRPLPSLIAVCMTFLLGIVVWPQLGESLFPAFKERDFLMHWISKPGSSLPEERRIVTKGSHELRAIPGVRDFGSHIGQAFLADEVAGVNFGENWVSVDPRVDYDKTLARIQRTVEGYPGLYRDVQTYLNERIDEVLAGVSEPILVRIFGDNLRTLHQQAENVKDELEKIPGIQSPHVELQVNVPTVDVTVKVAKARRYGLKPGDIRRAAATLVASEEVGDIFRGGKAYDVHVWSTRATRNSVTSIRQLPIDTPGGGRVALGEVAKVQLRAEPNVIHREDQSRRIDVGALVQGRDLGSVASDVQSSLQGTHFPLGYHAELLGEFAERQSASARLQLFAVAAAIGIFFLLQMAFGSWRLALLLFLTLPTALVGGVLASWLGTGIISLGSLVGFLTVLGIAARNGIMLISHYQHLERHEGESFGPGLVLRGARERLRPILMTALATGLALVPLVVTGDIPGHEIEHPMAVVIVGGLFTSTLLNLFILPALYLRFGRGTVPAGSPPA
ncbi:MAG TPA: efflux RND transporter permease subunit, partial [Actinomycetota bacterium]|nr:efflux RND transporter permease subunit [Actinomycetota bacterium]